MAIFNNGRRGFLTQMATAGLAAVATAPAARAGAGDKEEDLPLDKVPPAVRKSADKTVPKTKWIAATKVTSDGEISFELDGMDSKGKEVTVVLAEDGTLEEVEREISMKDVPKAVSDALKQKVAGFKVSVAHSTTVDGKIVSYSFEGKRAKDKEEVDVTVSADASSVDVDDD
jgi:hypothetical protein